MSAFSRSQVTRKPATAASQGVVAAQHRRAAEIGAAVLAAGGNAVDAAIAVSFVLGVVEPWMSGPAGGGAAMLWRAETGEAEALFYGLRTPQGLDPADFPLTGKDSTGDLFPWKEVVDDRNVLGATAVAVPGLVDGLGKAHARYGSMPWKDLVAPSVALAKEGIQVDWYVALLIASATRNLARDPDAAARFLEDGSWPTVANWTALSDRRINMSAMAPSLQAIADEGPRALYDGDLAVALAADVEAKGGSLRLADLRAYRAEWQKPLSLTYREARLHLTPHLTAGPTVAEVFRQLEAGFTPGREPDGAAYAAYAAALGAAYKRRLAEDGDAEEWGGGGYAGEDPRAPACTTHFSIVDRQGNMVAVTQTLLSAFGARVISPSTGLLLNNGVMWFDPEPGKPNSLAPGKRCLMNVCPLIGETSGGAGGRRFALGASGGRKIMPAVAQLASFLADFDMSLEEAFHQPRIDASGGEAVIADDSLAPEVLAALARENRVVTTRRTPYPFAFACPAGVLREENGTSGVNWGATEPLSPWGDAVAAG